MFLKTFFHLKDSQDSSQYIPQTQSQNQPPTRFQKQPPTQSLTYSQDKTQTHTQQQLPTQTNAKSVPRIQIQSLIYPQHNELHPETRNYKKSQSQSKIKAETKPSSAVPHYHSKEKVDAHETSASTVSNNLSIALGNKAQTSSLSRKSNYQNIYLLHGGSLRLSYFCIQKFIFACKHLFLHLRIKHFVICMAT